MQQGVGDSGSYNNILIFQPGKNRMFWRPVYIYLLGKLKSYAMINPAYFFHRFIGFRLLVFELIAGKPDNHQSFAFIFLMQFFKSFKLRRKPTFSGCIYYQYYLSFKFFHRQRPTTGSGSLQAIKIWVHAISIRRQFPLMDTLPLCCCFLINP